ncbi:MAG: PIN domain-containing protein [Acidobacteriota bacterium]
MKYLLDTNVLSEPVKPIPNALVLRQWRENADRICTASPVWNELLYGCYRLPLSKRRKAFEQYLREVLEPSLAILPYESRAADWHASERARLAG